jgi:membrane protein
MERMDTVITIKKTLSKAFSVAGALFRKYREDNANIIVSSISFYVILTFIPFTLLSISILGYVIDMSHADIHLERYLRSVLPEPYDIIIVKKVFAEINAISLSKRLSGPLGLIFLFFFTMKLFSVIRPAFRIIFGKHPERFIRGKAKELFFTSIFSLVQAIVFFSFIFTLVVQMEIISLVPDFFTRAPVIFLFSLLDMGFTFVLFYCLYYFLTPVRKTKGTLLTSSIVGTVLWYMGKYLFKYYILQIGRFPAILGAYGVFVAFLFWVYFSVFVFITCAELESVLLKLPNCGPKPSFSPSPEIPSEAPKE